MSVGRIAHCRFCDICKGSIYYYRCLHPVTYLTCKPCRDHILLSGKIPYRCYFIPTWDLMKITTSSVSQILMSIITNIFNHWEGLISISFATSGRISTFLLLGFHQQYPDYSICYTLYFNIPAFISKYALIKLESYETIVTNGLVAPSLRYAN